MVGGFAGAKRGVRFSALPNEKLNRFFHYLLARVRESGLVRNINKSTKHEERRKRWVRLRLYKGMSMGGIPALFPALSPETNTYILSPVIYGAGAR